MRLEDLLNDKILNECIELSKYQSVYNTYVTDGKFDIDKFKGNVNWGRISWHLTLSEEFIREFKDNVNWNDISWFQELSEEFIREFKDRVNWTNVSEYQKLSEEFIREFKDRVNWTNVSEYQKLSEEFICENLNNIHIEFLAYNKKINITKEFKDGLKILKMLIE